MEQKVQLPSKFCRHFANAISGLFTTGQSLDEPRIFTNLSLYHAGLVKPCAIFELHGMAQRFLFHLLAPGCDFPLKKSRQIDATFIVEKTLLCGRPSIGCRDLRSAAVGNLLGFYTFIFFFPLSQTEALSQFASITALRGRLINPVNNASKSKDKRGAAAAAQRRGHAGLLSSFPLSCFLSLPPTPQPPTAALINTAGSAETGCQKLFVFRRRDFTQQRLGPTTHYLVPFVTKARKATFAGVPLISDSTSGIFFSVFFLFFGPQVSPANRME